jgi:hypothetical protein
MILRVISGGRRQGKTYAMFKELEAEVNALRADNLNLVNKLEGEGYRLERLRAENVALKESLTWALDELKMALSKITWYGNNWESYGPVIKARALLNPQAAELVVLASIDAAEATVGKVIRWLGERGFIYGGLGDELEAEKLIEDAKIGIGLIRYEVAAEPPKEGS